MTSREHGPSTSRFPRTNDGPARNLRDNLAAIASGGVGSRRERLQFRCLKRLTLPRCAVQPRLAPGL
jgi:hypothetical protein